MPRYLDLRGHQVWSYEFSEKGEPFVLMHGGLSATEDIEKYIVPAFTQIHHVYAYDRTGHGRTADQPGSLHFDFQANEAIAYLEDVVRAPAHLVGWSDGGIIALLVAMRRPDLVTSLVAIGSNYHFQHGGKPIAPWIISQKDRAEHAERSPDPISALDAKTERMRNIWNSEPTLSLADLSKITCPTLILAADDEGFSLAHTTSLYEALPQGQLAIIPGTSHFVIKEKPALVQAIITDFLLDPSPPQTRVPVRRAKEKTTD